MEFFLNLLLFNGKFLTEPVSNTISETIRQCLRYKKKIILEYYRVTAVVGPYENMLDMINQNASDFAGDTRNNALLMETIENNFQFQDSLQKIKQYQSLGQNFGVISGQSMPFRRLGKKLYATKAPNRPVDPIAKNKSAANKVEERRRFHKKINDYLADNLNALLKSQEMVFKNIEKLVSLLEKDGKKLKEPRFDEIKKKIAGCKNILNNKPNHDLTIGRGIDEMVESEVTKCRQVKYLEAMVKPRKVRVHPLSIKVLSKQKLAKKDVKKSISKESKSSTSIKKSKVFQGSRSQNNLKLPTPVKHLDKHSRKEVAKKSSGIKSKTDLIQTSQSRDRFKYISPKRLSEEMDEAELGDSTKKNVTHRVAPKNYTKKAGTNQKTGSEIKKIQAASESLKHPGTDIKKSSSRIISSEFLSPQWTVDKSGASHTTKTEIKREEISQDPDSRISETTSKMIASEFLPPQKREATYTKSKEIKDEPLLVVPKNIAETPTKTTSSTKLMPKLFEQTTVICRNDDQLHENKEPTETNTESTDPIQAKDDDTKTLQFPQHWRIGETFKLVKTESKITAYRRKEFEDHKPKDFPPDVEKDKPELPTQNLQEKNIQKSDDKANFVLPKNLRIGQTFRVRRSDVKAPASKSQVSNSAKTKNSDDVTRDNLQAKHTSSDSPSQNSLPKDDNVTDNKKNTFQTPGIWQAGKTLKVTKTEIIKPKSSSPIEGSRRTRLFPNSNKNTTKTSTETLQTKDKSKEVSANEKTTNVNVERTETGSSLELRKKDVKADDKKTSFKFPKIWKAGQPFKVDRTEGKPAKLSKVPDPCSTKTQLSGPKVSTGASQTQDKPKGESPKDKADSNKLTSPPKDGYKDDLVIDRTCLSETFVYNLAIREKLSKVTMKIRNSSENNPKQSMTSDENPPNDNSPSQKTDMDSSRTETPAEDFSKSLKLKDSKSHMESKNSDTNPQQSTTSDKNPTNVKSSLRKAPKNSVDTSTAKAPAEDFSKSLKLEASKSHVRPKTDITRGSDPDLTRRPPIKVQLAESTSKFPESPRAAPDVTKDSEISKSKDRVSNEEATERKPSPGKMNENTPKKASSHQDSNPNRKPSKSKIPSNTKIVQIQRPKILDFEVINNQAEVIEVNENYFKQFETRLSDNLFTRRYLSLKEDFVDRCKRNFINRRIFRRLEMKINAEKRREEEQRMVENFFRVNDVMFQIMERKLLFQEPKEESIKICQLDDERWRLEAVDNDMCVEREQLDEEELHSFNDDFNDNDYFKRIDHSDIKKSLERDLEKSKIYELDEDECNLTTNLCDDFNDNDYFKQLDTKADLENVGRECPTRNKIRQLQGETCGQNKSCTTSCRKDVGRESQLNDGKSEVQAFNNACFKKTDSQVDAVEEEMYEKANFSQLDDERAELQALNNDCVKGERTQASQVGDKCQLRVLNNDPFDKVNHKTCQEIANIESKGKGEVSQLDRESKNLRILSDEFIELVEQKSCQEALEAETPEETKFRKTEEEKWKEFSKQTDNRIFLEALGDDSQHQIKVSRVDNGGCQLKASEKDDYYLKLHQGVEDGDYEAKRIEKDEYDLKPKQVVGKSEKLQLRSLEKDDYFTKPQQTAEEIEMSQITDKRSIVKTLHKGKQAEAKVYLAALEMAKIGQYENEGTENVEMFQLDNERSILQALNKDHFSKQLDDFQEKSRTVEICPDENETKEDVKLNDEKCNLEEVNKTYLESVVDKNCKDRLEKAKILQLVNELMKNVRISQLEDERSNLEILNSDYLGQTDDKISQEKLEKAKFSQLQNEIMENVTMSLLDDERSNLKALNQEYLKQVDEKICQDGLKKVEGFQLENEILKNIRISQLEDEISNLKALNKDYLKQVDDKYQEKVKNDKIVQLEIEMMENLRISQLEDERSNLVALNKDHIRTVDDRITQDRLKNAKILQTGNETTENVKISSFEEERLALDKKYSNQLEDNEEARVRDIQNIIMENPSIPQVDDELANLTALSEDYLKQVDEICQEKTQSTDGRSNLKAPNRTCSENVSNNPVHQETLHVKICQSEKNIMENFKISQLEEEISQLRALNEDCLRHFDDSKSRKIVERNRVWQLAKEGMEGKAEEIRMFQLEDERSNLKALNKDVLKVVDGEMCQGRLQNVKIGQLENQILRNIRISQLEDERCKLKALNQDYLRKSEGNICRVPNDTVKDISQLEDDKSFVEALNSDYSEQLDFKIPQKGLREATICQVKDEKVEKIKISQLDDERHKLMTLNQNCFKKLHHQVSQEGSRKTKNCQVENKKEENVSLPQFADGKKGADQAKDCQLEKTKCKEYFKLVDNKMCRKPIEKPGLNQVKTGHLTEKQNDLQVHPKRALEKGKTVHLEEARCKPYLKQIDNETCQSSREKQGPNPAKSSQIQRKIHVQPENSLEKVKICQLEEERCEDYSKQTDNRMSRKTTEKQSPVRTSQKIEARNEVHFHPIDQEFLQEVLKADRLESYTPESESFQQKAMRKMPSLRQRTHIDNVMTANKTAFKEFEQNLNVLLKPSTSKAAVKKAPKTENTKRKIDDPVKKSMSTKHLEYTNLAKARNTFSYYNPYLLVKNANDAKKSIRTDEDKISSKNNILRKSNLQKLAELQDMKEMQNLTRMESKLRTEIIITKIKSPAGDSDSSKKLIRRTTKAAMARSNGKLEDDTSLDRNSQMLRKPQKLHEFSKFQDDQEPTIQNSEDESLLGLDILGRVKSGPQQNSTDAKLCKYHVENVRSSSGLNRAKLSNPEVTTVHWELEDAENFHKIFVG